MTQRGPQELNVAGNADLDLYVVAIAEGSATDLRMSTKIMIDISEYSKSCLSSMYQTCKTSIPKAKLKGRNDLVILWWKPTEHQYQGHCVLELSACIAPLTCASTRHVMLDAVSSMMVSREVCPRVTWYK